MIRRVPMYYKAFTCIASDCKDNCCVGGWEIDIDEETAQYYKSLPGSFGDRLRAAIGRTDEDCFLLNEGRCPFLDEQNLCEIYGTLGEDKMGVVCTQFPRYSEYYGTVKETGLGLACEEAARIILSNREPFSMETESLQEEAVQDEEFDAVLAEQLYEVRGRCFAILEQEGSIFGKMTVLLKMSQELQQEINANHYEQIQEILKKYKPEASAEIQRQLVEQIEEQKQRAEQMDMQARNIQAEAEEAAKLQEAAAEIVSVYGSLEVLGEVWPKVVEQVLQLLHGENVSAESYRNYNEDFCCQMQPEAQMLVNTAEYFIFRYLMKASYDHDLFGKLQLCAVNLLMLQELCVTHWLAQKKTFTVQDYFAVVHIFSREVEYSEDNLEALAEEFLFGEVFEAESLIRLLLWMQRGER